MKERSRRVWLHLCLVVNFIVITSIALGAIGLSGDIKGEYEQGKIIVKFTPELATRVAPAAREGAPRISGNVELDKLNRDLGCKSMRSVSGKRGISAKERKEQLRKRFPTRAARAPKKARTHNLENIYVLTINKGVNIREAVNAYRALAGVEYAEPNYIYRLDYTPDDPYYSSSNSWGQGYNDMYGLYNIDAADAWDDSKGSGIVVAVVDSGGDIDHADLSGNVWQNTGEIADNDIDDDGNDYVDDVYGWDFYSDDNDPTDLFGHGTHCAGTIAAVGDNTTGVVGVAYESEVMVLKCSHDEDSISLAACTEAIVYATDNGADVISMSWSSIGGIPSAMREALEDAYDAGCVLVSSAGNASTDVLLFYPAVMREVIGVSAFDDDDDPAGFTNHGSEIDVGAPGVDVLSLRADSITQDWLPVVGTYYARCGGTSMAAPHVAGVAALILEENPSFSSEQVRQALRITADDVGDSGWDVYSGFGRVNAGDAVDVDPPCAAYFSSPEPGELFSGSTLAIEGLAYGPNFQSYVVDYGEGLAPTSWTTHNTSNTAVSTDGTLATSLSAANFEPGKYTLRLRVTSSDGTYEDRVMFLVPQDMQSGFPITTITSSDSLSTSGMKIADIDNDGVNELVLVSNGHLLAYEGDGNEVTGDWPCSDYGSFLVTPAIYDISSIYSGSEIIHMDDYLHLIKSDGNRYANYDSGCLSGGSNSGWDHLTVVCDLDDDGAQEAILPYGDYYNWVQEYFIDEGGVYALELNGDDVSGSWPVMVGGYPWTGSLSVGNVDDDPEMEVAFVDRENSYLYLTEHTGSNVSGWPIDPPTLLCLSDVRLGGTSMIDVDEDGFDEVVFVVGDQLCVYNTDGSQVSGFPVDLGVETLNTIRPIAGDLDGDDHLEILVALKGKIFQYNHDGSSVTNWPVTCANVSGCSLVLGDVDGDGDEEIVAIGVMPPVIHVFHHDGSAADAWPLPLTEPWAAYGVPAIGDLDGDGDAELTATSWGFTNCKIYAFDCDGVPTSPVPHSWPSHGGNPRNHNRYYSFVQGEFALNISKSQTLDVTVEIANDATDKVVEYEIECDSDREFTIEEVVIGDHDMTVKPYTYLRVGLNSQTIDPGGSSFDFGTSKGGDLDDDNDVDDDDLTLFTAAYGSEPEDPNWNEYADFDGDDDVDFLDLSGFSSTYGHTGVDSLLD